MKKFAGKRVLITGASSSIGIATAEHLAEEGATLVLASRHMERLRQAGRRVAERADTNVEVIQFDAADASSCSALVDRAVEVLHGIDVVCNIAGVTSGGDFCMFPASEWEKIIATDLGSVFYVTQRALPHLLTSRGNVVTVSSVAAQGMPYFAAYSAAKAAAVALMRSIALEFSEAGVRANAVSPGVVRSTDIQKREFFAGVEVLEKLRSQYKSRQSGYCTAEDVAAAIAYVASPDGRSVTGQNLIIDGGLALG